MEHDSEGEVLSQKSGKNEALYKNIATASSSDREDLQLLKNNYFHKKPLDCKVLELQHPKHGSGELKTKGEQNAKKIEKTNYSKKDNLSSAKSLNNPSVNNSLLVKTGQLSRSDNEIQSTVNTARNNLIKERTLEKIPERIDSQVIITELEERNTKLAEEKVKLSVQLGVQSKVMNNVKTSNNFNQCQMIRFCDNCIIQI